MSTPSQLAALRAALTASFKNGFVTGDPPAPPFPVKYENQAFVQPKGSTWGMFSFVTSDRDFMALGALEFRTLGIAFLQVFQAEELGTKDAYTASDLVAALWDATTLIVAPGAAVLFRAVTVKRIGKTDDGWYQFNVAAPFQFDVAPPPADPAPAFTDADGNVFVDADGNRFIP